MSRTESELSGARGGRSLSADASPLEGLSGVTTTGALIGWGTLALIVLSTLLPHAHVESMNHVALWSCSAAAAMVNGVALAAMRSPVPKAWHSALLWAWATGLTGFLALMTFVGGGFPSDLYALDFPAVVFVATVLPSPAGALSGVATAGLYTVAVVAAPQQFRVGDLVVRCGALVATGLVAAELARLLRRETMRRAAVQAQAQTRATLLQELHHRVKNDLQTVAELLSLEAHRTPARSQVELVDQTVSRIQSIAAVHNLLAVEPGTADATELAERVVALQTRNQARPEVGVTVHGGPLPLEIERATCLALVVNELLTNALAHGLPDGRAGRVAVTLEREGDQALLMVADDGLGFDSATLSEHLGLSLVRRLVRDGLGGEFWICEGDPGAVARLRFPLDSALVRLDGTGVDGAG